MESGVQKDHFSVNGQVSTNVNVFHMSIIHSITVADIIRNICFLSFFLMHRFLDRAPDGSVFISLCFVLRSVNAIGFAGAVTSSFAVSAKVFPDNIATILVSFSQHVFVKNSHGIEKITVPLLCIDNGAV